MAQQPKSQLNNSQLERMVEISRILNSTTNVDTLLHTIITEAANMTGAEAASILLLDPQTRQLHFRAASNSMEPGMLNTAVPLDNSIAGAVFQSNRPAIIADVSREPRWNENVDKAIDFQTRSILAVPMHDVERPVGVLEALNKQEGAFTTADVETLSTLADIAGVAVEKARLIEELQLAYNELNELDQVKTDFIAVASHELRTPLAVIMGYVSFLRDEASPDMAGHLDQVMDASQQLRALIQDMLNLRYTDSGDTPLQLKEIDLVTLVRDMVMEKEEVMRSRQHTVTLRLGKQPLWAHIDPEKMGQVLSNLLNNAAKFTGTGGRIEVAVYGQGSEAWFRIRDNGMGIPSDKLERIFKRFYQVESSLNRRHEGMGLGLAIARELVLLHNGRIWAESDGQNGSTFYMVLPLTQR
ncbi:MAG: HAMP domain-containing sensor histidine kinase [Chloroflexota bacterium]